MVPVSAGPGPSGRQCRARRSTNSDTASQLFRFWLRSWSKRMRVTSRLSVARAPGWTGPARFGLAFAPIAPSPSAARALFVRRRDSRWAVACPLRADTGSPCCDGRARGSRRRRVRRRGRRSIQGVMSSAYFRRRIRPRHELAFVRKQKAAPAMQPHPGARPRPKGRSRQCQRTPPLRAGSRHFRSRTRRAMRLGGRGAAHRRTVTQVADRVAAASSTDSSPRPAGRRVARLSARSRLSGAASRHAATARG